MHKEIEKYLNLVDFLADFLGDTAEVVLHDFSQLENSVVAIKNSHISGRRIGSPATDLVLSVLNNKKDCTENYMTNYKSISASGIDLKSGSFFIKDEKNELIGMLCINIDISDFINLQKVLTAFIPQQTTHDNSTGFSETLSPSSNELTTTTIEKVVSSFNIPPERMDQNEKIQVVKQLNKMGIFLIKGVIPEVANTLNVSIATVYRYLSIVKRADSQLENDNI